MRRECSLVWTKLGPTNMEIHRTLERFDIRYVGHTNTSRNLRSPPLIIIFSFRVFTQDYYGYLPALRPGSTHPIIFLC